ncbi:5-formyltetrahydrofolate cyclo-ligase [Jiella pacifica]|uniref:5-formyltetrahydrofolate cyclo-ligase n=1 Tax=Jiella pacifica TaxID=2696469 RepID=A0A6N9TD44_9HYPH|nr:5-formyltetrahydrofolate cyclo-ligase [Jiella pacifica]NDW08006.1 5-formyltetrahydrofolate cyclo-ligase [Jiella pacifica]
MDNDAEAHQDDEPNEYSSPACFLHELTPDITGIGHAAEGLDDGVIRWRKIVRPRLIEMRAAIRANDRKRMDDVIRTRLSGLLATMQGRIVSIYWPMKAEPNLIPWVKNSLPSELAFALPVVIKKGAPMEFRSWSPGESLIRGVWNIPIPEHGASLVPDIVIAPVVGFDKRGYRLGYGGGYFDRTLAVLARKPYVIGIGYAQAAIETIYPLKHDIPMDVIVTEQSCVSYASSSRLASTLEIADSKSV